ncbi:ABC transporter substrate-binding protein [Bradyrhizobium sp.]|uniref:ABC transporter substrate-binding protein n=2 Tax=Bradyrhizobium sp. TaxID=376 RepID=UPI001DD63FA4|nr:ABC transporter substrate-binding protein [Bradyrhizobium sp.]MBV8696735.1 ABC transporter substrate-binding protein [Bradyrhizobium sp.]MBV8918419.1 ABC transporter substrate-binding protein [Bradyrhizobium sp.]MBV9982723.1 ABC transporter substrate-binding protein [Bradyrhizobium sp.]
MKSSLSALSAACLGLFLGLLACVAMPSEAAAAAKCIKGDRKPPFTIGWADIYSVPTWMKETQGTIEKEVDELKKQGLVSKLVVTDAQGDANTQIQQIQSMIDSNVDAIILIAGSSTAPGRVIADACAKGIAVINFDSLVDTDEVTAKINTDSAQWGASAAKFLVDAIGGKGKILVLNGPAGISVSDDRRKGAEPVLKANPNVTILAETNTAYNVAPAQEAVTNLLFAHPDIDGILSLGGALSAGAVLAFDKQGRAQVPITGENARQFLELWKAKNLKAWATMQPNWLGAFATYAAVQALSGKDVPAFVKIPLPVIDNSNIDQYLAKAKDFPADGYIYSPYDQKLFDELLAQK